MLTGLKRRISFGPNDSDVMDPALDPTGAQARQRLENLPALFGDRQQRIGAHLTKLREQAGVTNGRVLEIGARQGPLSEFFVNFEYQNIDLEATDEATVVADIAHCPELPDASFDAIVSVDVLQHVRQPWRAAEEITRLLRPGGFTYHSTVFSWRYQPSPVDFWRFSPEALDSLFGDLTLMRADLDVVERRRNLVGRGQYKLEPDAFGGWRENWRVFYAGVKPGLKPGASV